ncbi:hypothetical protein LAC81_25435 [Ensifer adhaerens]|uniref:hypothetical protein n=1 Tax=Ensifer adhaerens TaxID=106592 RepID=UPI001CC08597|nr:hypothetical protein [Ensifer adhaerens]MBZ7927042.1 hypothetical protein [Ensifer adhaerens]UAX96657.1 hypothetical protein LAC78_23050 [Ensifer adhaerens]UAY03999.1 hypothetical protein LAC80_21910 [Ensifer adhaerens]UAY11985.1 hypothetical protein LAC81_25435 [Ensifer adhaerens]
MLRVVVVLTGMLLTAGAEGASLAQPRCATLGPRQFCVPREHQAPPIADGVAVRTTIGDLLLEEIVYQQSASVVTIAAYNGFGGDDEVEHLKSLTQSIAQRSLSKDPAESTEGTGRIPNLSVTPGSDGVELVVAHSDTEPVPSAIAECRASSNRCNLYFTDSSMAWKVSFPYERRFQLSEIKQGSISFLNQFAVPFHSK